MEIGKMKFIILIALLSYSLSLKINKSQSLENQIVVYDSYIPSYPLYSTCLTDPYYYYSSYYPTYTYTYGVSYITPVTYLMYRKNGENEQQKERKELTLEEAEKELLQLKELIFKDKDFNTEELRKNKKYDNEFLVKELKKSRALEIEDILKMMEKSKPSDSKKRIEELKPTNSKI